MELLADIGIIAACEAGATALFYLMARWNRPPEGTEALPRLTWRGLMKGWIERGFLVYALISGYPHALTLFAALKIATRIRDDQRISNDFYLIGNLVSVSLAIVYSQLISDYFL